MEFFSYLKVQSPEKQRQQDGLDTGTGEGCAVGENRAQGDPEANQRSEAERLKPKMSGRNPDKNVHV